MVSSQRLVIGERRQQDRGADDRPREDQQGGGLKSKQTKWAPFDLRTKIRIMDSPPKKKIG